ncbi:MAG: dephospho-CoA kinase, partial [Bacilli bacterium]|nr:dephospho-CoA kinase [Bacilli bacterium]
FLASLEKKFKGTTKDGQLDKDYVTNKMIVDKKFARSYETFIWSNIKDVINSFLIANSESITCVEVPLLFESHLDKVFTFLVGVESSSQRENLISRGEEDVDRKLDLNKRSLYDFNRHKLNYIIENDGSKEELKSKVKDIYLDILKK